MKVLAFGIAKNIFGNNQIEVDLEDGASIDKLKTILEKKYPLLNQLGSYMVAVNMEYASKNDHIRTNDEVAIIPPVSGG
jgi:molybdopterin converting factor subunit 1